MEGNLDAGRKKSCTHVNKKNVSHNSIPYSIFHYIKGPATLPTLPFLCSCITMNLQLLYIKVPLFLKFL